MEELALHSGEITPVSAVSDEDGNQMNPIIREPRARFHRSSSGNEMQVTIEVRIK